MAASENSFDVACKLDMQEVANAINQAKREIETRYDLKGSKNEVAQEKMDIVLSAPDDMKLHAVLDLTPKSPTPLLTRLVLTIDPKDSIVRQAVLFDQFQNTVTMTFTRVTTNSGLGDPLFVFTPPAGAAVVPLEMR